MVVTLAVGGAGVGSYMWYEIARKADIIIDNNKEISQHMKQVRQLQDQLVKSVDKLEAEIRK